MWTGYKFIKENKTEQNKQKQKHFSDKQNGTWRGWDTIALLKNRIVDCMVYVKAYEARE